MQDDVPRNTPPPLVLPKGFELDTPTVEERFLQIERELGLVPTAGNSLAQGLTAKITGRVEPLAEEIGELKAKLASLEGAVDRIIGKLHQLKKSAFKHRP